MTCIRISVPRGVKISMLPLPDVTLLDFTADAFAIAKAMVAQARREPHRSETVRGMRLIRGAKS